MKVESEYQVLYWNAERDSKKSCLNLHYIDFNKRSTLNCDLMSQTSYLYGVKYIAISE